MILASAAVMVVVSAAASAQPEPIPRSVGIPVALAVILLLLAAAVAHLAYRRRRQLAESEDRRQTEGHLGTDRYWGTVIHWSLPGKQVQANAPLLTGASTPAEIARLLVDRKLSGTLQVIERTVLEPEPEVLVGWLQERAAWLQKISTPVNQKWHQQNIAVVLVSNKGFVPMRPSVEALALHLQTSVGAALIVREPKPGSAIERDGLSMLIASIVLPSVALVILSLTPWLKYMGAPNPDPVPHDKPKDLGLILDAGTDADGPGKSHDAGETVDAGKRSGLTGAKAPDAGAAKDPKADPSGKKDKDKKKDGESGGGKPHGGTKKPDKADKNPRQDDRGDKGDRKDIPKPPKIGGPANPNPNPVTPMPVQPPPKAGPPPGQPGGGNPPSQPGAGAPSRPNTGGAAHSGGIPSASDLRAPGAPPPRGPNPDAGTQRVGGDVRTGQGGR